MSDTSTNQKPTPKGPFSGRTDESTVFSQTPSVTTAFEILQKTLNEIQNGERTNIQKNAQPLQNVLDAVHALTSIDPGKGEDGLKNSIQILSILQANQNELTADDIGQMAPDAKNVVNMFSDKPSVRDAAKVQIYTRISQFNQQRTDIRLAKGDTSKVGIPDGARPLLQLANNKIAKKVSSTVGKRLYGEVISKGIATAFTAVGLPALGALVGKIAAWVGEKILWPLIKKSKEVIATGLGIAGLGFIVGSPIVVAAGATTALIGVGVGGTGAIKGALNTIATVPSLLAMETLAALGTAFIIFLVGGTFLTALMLFIINSGAYIVPPNNQGTLGSIDATCAGTITGSCPVPNGEVYVGSFRGANTYAHGANRYFELVSEVFDREHPENSCFQLPIPVPACLHNSDPASYCYNAQANCPMYGYAADIRYVTKPTNCAQFVYFPQLGGQTLSWSRNNNEPVITSSCGNGYTYIASNGSTTHEMLFMHLNPTNVTSGQSGQPVGSILTYATNTCMGSATNEHTHIEWRINGEYVRPDNLCSGQSTIVTQTDPSTLRGRLYLFPLNRTTIDDILATQAVGGTYRAQSACTWAAQNNAEVAVNANFFASSTTPRGIAGDNGVMYQYFDATEYDFRTFYIDNDGNFGIDEYVTPEPGRVDDYEFAVTGVFWDNYLAANINQSRPRVALALEGNTLALLVTENGTPGQIRAYMNGRGYADNEFFMLDGGSSTTLCEGGEPTYRATYPSGATAVPVSLGFRQDIVSRAQVITVGAGLTAQP